MGTPKFPRGSKVEFNEEPLTVLFLASLYATTGRDPEQFIGIFTVQDLKDPETDPELDDWEVCIKNALDQETWVSEIFLRLAQTSHN